MLVDQDLAWLKCWDSRGLELRGGFRALFLDSIWGFIGIMEKKMEATV